MSFRHGSNVEFEGPNFVANPTAGMGGVGEAAGSGGSSGGSLGKASSQHSGDIDLQERRPSPDLHNR